MVAPLQPEYTTSPEEPTRPASEAMLTILPALRAAMPCATACVTCRGPNQLMAVTFFQNASSVFRNGMGVSQPALLTRISVPRPIADLPDSPRMQSLLVDCQRRG